MGDGIASARLRMLCRAAIAFLALAGMTLAADPPAHARSPARVRVSYDTEGPSTRLVLTLSRPVTYAVTRSGKRLAIVYSEPIVMDPPSAKVDDPILQGWKQDGERTVSLRLGRRFESFESFELKNPSRLIIDLLGQKPSAATSTPVRPTDRRERPIIVIDPGHGGIEKGAIGPNGSREKDVTLDLALRLKRLLERYDISVVLTRDDDRLVSLDERTAIANHNRATLFISIHLNSSRRVDAYGAETYFLSAEASDDEARTLSALENQAYKDPDREPGRREGEGDALELILWDLAQNQFLAESSALAESVQRQLNVLAGTRNRGVRQAPFRVLTGATMPAILVEVGFVSNLQEEELLQMMPYRDRVVEAIARAVTEFLNGRARIAGPSAGAMGGASQP
jgi:N-acetylmuramoyl-L-alanine amidase